MCLWVVCNLLWLVVLCPYLQLTAHLKSGSDTGSKGLPSFATACGVLVAHFKAWYTFRYHAWLYRVKQCRHLPAVYVSIITCDAETAGKVELSQLLQWLAAQFLQLMFPIFSKLPPGIIKGNAQVCVYVCYIDHSYSETPVDITVQCVYVL